MFPFHSALGSFIFTPRQGYSCNYTTGEEWFCVELTFELLQQTFKTFESAAHRPHQTASSARRCVSCPPSAPCCPLWWFDKPGRVAASLSHCCSGPGCKDTQRWFIAGYWVIRWLEKGSWLYISAACHYVHSRCRSCRPDGKHYRMKACSKILTHIISLRLFSWVLFQVSVKCSVLWGSKCNYKFSALINVALSHSEPLIPGGRDAG